MTTADEISRGEAGFEGTLTAKRRFELLVFDWDGTLMDSAAVIVASIQAAVRDIGLPPPDDDAARHIIGLGLKEAIAYLLPSLEVSRYGELVARYRHHFLSRDQDIPLFPGAFQIVERLHAEGFMLAVATGKSRAGLDRAFQHTGLGPYFHGSRCADESFSKPHPGMLQELMGEMGATPEQTLMIGDTSHDLQMALNAGVPSLAAAYGAHPREELLACSPLACLDSIAELDQWLSTHA